VTPPFGAPQRALLRQALREGRVLTFPTETTYALGGNALLPALVQSIYRLKGRDRDKPMLLLVDGSRGLADWVGGVPPGAAPLMERFWPGPLTLVFRAGPGLPPHLPDARGTVALRWSPHPLVAELLALGGAPLIGTSANRSGTPELTSAQAVLAAFPGEPILAVDGGPAPGGLPSTVLDVTERPFHVVRVGAVPVGEIRAALLPAFADLAPPEPGV
jgi:L-threonylcarbamoyladenylate synthase